jgi:pyridoxine 5-phosphate synthase
MINLSVNVNKIATLRNSRGGDIPNLLDMTKIILDAGAQGITVHPRADERHIKRKDVFEIKEFLTSYKKSTGRKIEFNIEGEPSDRFLKLVLEAKPDQATLVPVTPGEITSDHGFQFPRDVNLTHFFALKMKMNGIRISVFVEPELNHLTEIQNSGADRVEFYTGPFAYAFSIGRGKQSFEGYKKAAEFVKKWGLGINAGHDLDEENLKLFRELPGLEEVSIGHRLIAKSLVLGLESTVGLYLQTLSEAPSGS